MQAFQEWQADRGPQRRFRASIYVDIFVPQSDSLEADRQKAQAKVEWISRKIPNSYVGGVAHYDPHNLLKPLDKEI